MQFEFPEIRPEERTPLVETLLGIIRQLLDHTPHLELPCTASRPPVRVAHCPRVIEMLSGKPSFLPSVGERAGVRGMRYVENSALTPTFLPQGEGLSGQPLRSYYAGLCVPHDMTMLNKCKEIASSEKIVHAVGGSGGPIRLLSCAGIGISPSLSVGELPPSS
jgi:hypothetical protein